MHSAELMRNEIGRSKIGGMYELMLRSYVELPDAFMTHGTGINIKTELIDSDENEISYRVTFTKRPNDAPRIRSKAGN